MRLAHAHSRVGASHHRAGAAAAVCIAACLSAPCAAADGPRRKLVQAGELTCDVGSGANPFVGVDRDVTCSFTRSGVPVERYEGLTGFVSGSPEATRAIVFAVAMAKPRALAALGGDYAGGGALGADGTLVGGIGDGVVLTPVDGTQATALAPLNALLRLNQLHLNYAGRSIAAERDAR